MTEIQPQPTSEAAKAAYNRLQEFNGDNPLGNMSELEVIKPRGGYANKQERMDEMDNWAKNVGAMTEQQAENRRISNQMTERRIARGEEPSQIVDKYHWNNELLSEMTTGGGYYNGVKISDPISGERRTIVSIDKNNTIRQQLNGVANYYRSPKNILDQSKKKDPEELQPSE